MSLHEISENDTNFQPEPGTSYSDENIPPGIRKPKNRKFCWDEFLEENGCQPATDFDLFKHCNYMQKTVFEVLFMKDYGITIEKNGCLRPATINIAVGSECYVEYQDVDYHDSEWIKLDEIITDPSIVRDVQPEIWKALNREIDFVDMDEVIKYWDYLDRQIHTLIEPGKYLEISDQQTPNILNVVKVKGNHGGMVVYESPDETGLQCIHISDLRCHPLGFGTTNSDEYIYEKEHKVLREVFANMVPAICFGKIGSPYHNFHIGQPIEYLDNSTGFFAYPGHISEILNSRLAIVDIYTDKKEEPDRICVTQQTPGIYPMGYVEENKITMHTPMFLRKKQEAFSWTNYMNHFKLSIIPSFDTSFGVRHDECIQPMQYVEYFSYEFGLMAPALIVRSTQNSVWLSTDMCKSRAQAIHCFVGSNSIFPVNYADTFGVPFWHAPELPNYIPEKPTNPDMSRYSLERIFKTVPSPVFRKPQYSGRGRPEKTWNFLPDAAHYDNWVPKTYINRTCRTGQWIDSKAFATLNDCFQFGPVAGVVDEIFKGFLSCTKHQHRDDVYASFDVTDPKYVFPKQLIKCKGKKEAYMLTIQACESCESFNGWLRNFLKCYQCCPNLLSVYKQNQCAYGCADFREPEYSPLQNNGRKSGNVEARRRHRTRQPQGTQSVTDLAASRHKQGSSLDIPEYAKWAKVRMIDYLVSQNLDLKVQLKQLFNKKQSVTEILQCREPMGFIAMGFRPKDAKRIFDAIEKMRETYR